MSVPLLFWMENSVVTQWCRPAAPRGDTHTAGISHYGDPVWTERRTVSLQQGHIHLWQRHRCPTVSSLQTHNVKPYWWYEGLGRRPVWAPRYTDHPVSSDRTTATITEHPRYQEPPPCSLGPQGEEEEEEEEDEEETHPWTSLHTRSEHRGCRQIDSNKHTQTHTHVHTSDELLTILQMEAMFLTVI